MDKKKEQTLPLMSVLFLLLKNHDSRPNKCSNKNDEKLYYHLYGTNINISFDKIVIVYPTKSCSTFSEIQNTFIFYTKSFSFIIDYFKLSILFFEKFTHIE